MNITPVFHQQNCPDKKFGHDMNLFHQWLQYKNSKILIYFWENFQIRKMQKNIEICKRDKIT